MSRPDPCIKNRLEVLMTRPFTTLAVALACACTLGLRADAQSTSRTKVEAEHGKTVTYTGCVQSGSEADSYILANVIPTSDSSYLLVPEKTVMLHEHLGQRVQVTGVMIEAGHGDAKIETRTKENGSVTKTKEEVKRGPFPQFRVVSVKPLGQACQ
jgi:hypothetical protein